MADVVAWLRKRARSMENREFGNLAAAVLNDAADALELARDVPKASP